MELLNLSFFKIVLLFMTFFIVIIGSLINWFETYLPVFLPQTFRYGKFAYSGKPSTFKVIEVPKSWFKHFYVFASLYSLWALYIVIDVYFYGAKLSSSLLLYLDILCGSSQKTNSGSTAVIIALFLILLQSFRRFYETWFVSVFSKGKINISQYLVGYIHYWATITIVLAEARGFKSAEAESEIDKTNIHALQILGILLFAYAWTAQYKSSKILANLRKNTHGDVVTIEHKIPYGGLFTYVSSPHLSCEVLIYLSLWMILHQNDTFKYVFMWVLSNQLETSLLNHWWYQKTFKNYPKERKALVPYIL